MIDKEVVFCAWPEQWQLKSHRKTKFPCTFQELKGSIFACNFDLHLCYNCTYIVYNIFSENCQSWRRVWVGGSEDGYRYLIIISGLQIVEIFVCSLVQNTFGIAKKIRPSLKTALASFFMNSPNMSNKIVLIFTPWFLSGSTNRLTDSLSITCVCPQI